MANYHLAFYVSNINNQNLIIEHQTSKMKYFSYPAGYPTVPSYCFYLKKKAILDFNISNEHVLRMQVHHFRFSFVPLRESHFTHMFLYMHASMYYVLYISKL